MAAFAARRFCVSTVGNLIAGHSCGAARLGYGVGVLAGENACRRAIHGSPVVLKKKSKVVIEDLFSEDTEPAEDLLSDPDTPRSSKPAAAATKATASPAAKESYSSKRLSPTRRHKIFEEHYNSLLPYLNAKDAKERRKIPPIKHSVWTLLLQLAQSEEELRRVMELIPKWRDCKRHSEDGGGMGEQWGELFVSRAESLSCPTAAVELFSNHSKYQVPLSLPAARSLLHALHVNYSTEDIMTTVALYRVYGLPAIANDLVSLGLVCRALAGKVYPIPEPPAPASSSPESENAPEPISSSTKAAAKQVLDALLVSLRQLLSKTNPSLYTVSPHARTRALTPPFEERQKQANRGLPAKGKEKTWLMRCLARLEKSVSSGSPEGSDGMKWLREWRERAGHVKTIVNAA